MARVEITDEEQDRLFGIFDTSQDLQRRIVRMIARGFYHEHGLQELRWKAEGIAKEIADLTDPAQGIVTEGQDPKGLGERSE